MKNISAWEFVKNLTFGWNLGNTLDGGSRNAFDSPKAHETAWGNPVTTDGVAKLLKDTGFGIFRVPVTWSSHIGNPPNFIITPEWIDRVREVVDYGISNGLYVILNLHHENWHFPSYENYDAAEARLTKIWGQIAAKFKEYDEHLIFEAMNEPRMNRTKYEWTGGTPEARNVINKLNAAFIQTVRSAGGNNIHRQLMIPTYAASSDETVMRDLVVGEYDKNIIVSVHAYTPYLFALSEEDVKEWSPDNPKDTKDIDSLFGRIDDIFLSKQIPVIMGEMGARNKDNIDARVRWAKYYASKAREYGVPCIWWDNGAFTGNGELFGLMDRRNLKWAFPEIVEAFLN